MLPRWTVFCFSANRLQQPNIWWISDDLYCSCFDWQLCVLRFSAVYCGLMWDSLQLVIAIKVFCFHETQFVPSTLIHLFEHSSLRIVEWGATGTVVLIQDACWPAGASWLLPGNWHTHGSAHCEGGLARGQLWVTPWILQGHEIYFYQLQEL